MNHIFRMTVFSIAALCCSTSLQAASDADWQAMSRYQYGQDFKPLLAINREIIDVSNSPQRRQACAARLAALLNDPQTTLPAKQFICNRLQILGTSQQVTLLAKMLDDPKTAEMARMALEKIPGDESSAVLRGGLKKYQGKLLLGLISSLATRQDASSIESLKTLADGKSPEVSDAAILALGRVDGPAAAEFLAQKVAQAGSPIPQNLAVAYLRCADRLAKQGKTEAAAAIYARMSQPDVPTPNRQAALQASLDASGNKTIATTIAWLAGNDDLKRQLAAGKLNSLTDAKSTQALIAELPKLPVAAKVLLLKALSARREKAVLPAVLAAAKSDDPTLSLAAIECLAKIGGVSNVPLLVEPLAGKTQLAQAAAQSLADMSGQDIDGAILESMAKADEATRVALIDVLRRRKSTVAVPAFLAEAAQADPARHVPAIQGLRNLATPSDVPALIGLLAKTPKGKHRDEIGKTILLVCSKTKNADDRAAPVLAVLDKADDNGRCLLLPVAGRLGGPAALKTIDAAVKSDNPKIRDAAVRALCNWPDATVADRLLAMVKQTQNRSHRTWALRAYIRVVSLKSERPPAETLALLRGAMQLAKADPQRRLVLQRAATVRTMHTLRWVSPYLDNPDLSQAACGTVVELAHHRFLRNPNKAEFAKPLKKVTEIANDPKLVERAKRYMLGL